MIYSHINLFFSFETGWSPQCPMQTQSFGIPCVNVASKVRKYRRGATLWGVLGDYDVFIATSYVPILGIYPEGAPGHSYLDFSYVGGTQNPLKDPVPVGTLQFRNTLPNGTYNYRYMLVVILSILTFHFQMSEGFMRVLIVPYFYRAVPLTMLW